VETRLAQTGKSSSWPRCARLARSSNHP